MILRIGYIDYTVRAFTEREMRDDNDAWGRMSTGAAEISIDRFVSPREQARILIHEIVHCCYAATAGVGGRPDKLDEEEVCCMVDRGLTMVLLANPELTMVLHQAIHHERPVVQ